MVVTLGQPRTKLIAAILCFLLAGLVWALTRTSSTDVPADATTWTTCVHCGHSEEMPLREFFHQQQQEIIRTGNSMAVPRLVCSQCGQHGVLRAMKCPQCGEVFIEGEIPDDFYDRCPSCHFSAIEQRGHNATSQP